MKPKALLIIVGVFIVFASVKRLFPPDTGRPPRFIPGPPASIVAYKWSDYGWPADALFQNDKLWVRTLNGTNFHNYLYDLRQRTVVGELVDGGTPELWNRDGSRIMVTGHGSTETAAQTMLNVFRKMVGAPLLGDRIETFWILDLPSNTAKKVGAVSQSSHSGSSWHSSPDFRYGYTMPSTAYDKAISLCDFDRHSFTTISVQGHPSGWWDERNILMNTPTDEFELLDVETGTTRKLFDTADIKAAFTRAVLTNAPSDIRSFFNWNGSNYDFYFGPKMVVTGLHGDGYLLKANRAGPSLELVDRNFGYRWGGSLDRSATHYLYQGESGTLGHSADGAVYLRDLSDGKVSTVVPPDNKGQYSIPRIYGNEVIYFRDRAIHRVGLDGSNDTLLLTNGGYQLPLEKTSK